MPKRGFKGLTEVSGLDDARARLLVLGNWHKLNSVLRLRPSSADVRRLLALEIAMGEDARGNFVERLRAALGRAEARERKAYVRPLMRTLRAGKRPRPEDLRALGLRGENIKTLLTTEDGK